jgi:NAD(P)-dependent dehydrogenase (short-subunit alcohol dehydrogenase family)
VTAAASAARAAAAAGAAGAAAPAGTAVVVGATGSVGSAIVRRLTARGMPVLAVARGKEPLDELASASGLVMPCTADIGQDAAIEAIRSCLAGPVAVAVMAAGLPVRGSADTIDPGMLAAGADIKLGGTVRLLHAVRGRLGPGSRFVAFAGTLGIEPRAHEAGPGAINAGLLNLMRQISLLYGPRGVTVHTISPGPADTPRLRRIAEAVAAERGLPFDEVWAGYAERNSLGRLPTADEIAWAVTLLLDPEAAVMHGGVLHLDGGGLSGIH